MYNMQIIRDFNNILNSFNIGANCINYKKVDNYFFYDVKLHHHTKVKDIQKYSDEISLALKTPCKPRVKVLHSEGIVRLEFVSLRHFNLNLFDYFTNDNIPEGKINCLLGQTIDGHHMWIDLAANPHMIIAGTTGSGKSTLLHNIIANLFNYNKVQLFLMDPKNIEFSEYEKIPYNVNVSYTYNESLFVLDSLLEMMDQRYEMIRSGFPVDNFPYVVLIIDELADLILQDHEEIFYNKLCRLSQKCRAARIHLILSTQRPSVNIIKGDIKANFPARIACRTTSYIDSRVILDAVGAENLLGKGDALIRDNSRFLERFQIAYTNSIEVCNYFG